jgi:hypothetical protein
MMIVRPVSVTVAPVRTSRRLGVTAALRCGAVAGALGAAIVGSAVLAAGPALAIGERGDPSGKLSAIETGALFVGIPVGVAAVIAFLVFLPAGPSVDRNRELVR